jgi:hypothetical protein
MEINGVPLHPLVVHASVVFVPLAALSAVLYALVPRWRWALRHPMLALGGMAVGATQLASLSGENLKDSRKLFSPLVEKHEMWAGRLLFSMWVLAALIAIAWWVLPSVTALVGRSDRSAGIPALVLPVTVVLPIAAVVTLIFVYFTGDAGAQAVWKG